jgi:hypothetical protein
MPITTEPIPRADFFVHPDYHRLGGYLMTEEVERYEAALHDRIDDSSLPILIYNPGGIAETGAFWRRFPADQRFRSQPESGLLDDDYVTKAGLNLLLSERAVLRGAVHGSYLAQCVRAFKKSMAAVYPTGTICALPPYDEVTGYYHDVCVTKDVKYGLVLQDKSRQRPFPEYRDLEQGLPLEHFVEDAQVFSVH